WGAAAPQTLCPNQLVLLHGNSRIQATVPPRLGRSWLHGPRRCVRARAPKARFRPALLASVGPIHSSEHRILRSDHEADRAQTLSPPSGHDASSRTFEPSSPSPAETDRTFAVA